VGGAPALPASDSNPSLAGRRMLGGIDARPAEPLEAFDLVRAQRVVHPDVGGGRA
jgi:hypothetical protein